MSQTIIPSQSNISAPNLFIEAANGVTFGYRRLGSRDDDSLPLICLQHFRGNLDNWDPALVDTLAARREVILFDNAGVGGSSGVVPRTMAPMAEDALAFIDALGLDQVDVLGFSMGGFVAQELTLTRPRLVRRLVLAGTGPQGGVEAHGFRDEVNGFAMKDEQDVDDVLALFFERSAASIAKGREYVERIFTRAEDRDTAVDLAARDAQMDAISTWGIPDPGRLDRLAGIEQPVLVANGDNDRMVPNVNTYLLAGHLPDARLRIYPDAGHGFLFQYPEEFAAEVESFLTTDDAADFR